MKPAFTRSLDGELMVNPRRSPPTITGVMVQSFSLLILTYFSCKGSTRKVPLAVSMTNGVSHTGGTSFSSSLSSSHSSSSSSWHEQRYSTVNNTDVTSGISLENFWHQHRTDFWRFLNNFQLDCSWKIVHSTATTFSGYVLWRNSQMSSQVIACY